MSVSMIQIAYQEVPIHIRRVRISVSSLGDLLDLEQLVKAFGNN